MPIPAERLHKHSVSGLLSEKQSFLSTPAEGRGINNQRSGLGSNDIFFAGGVISLDADGFTVGSNNRVNNAGTTYYWIAFKEDALSLKVSTYTGDGVDNHVITGVGFTPVAVLGFREGTSNVSIKTSSMASNDSKLFYSTSTYTDRVKTLMADGFTLGTNAEVNANGGTYHYVVWKAVAGSMQTGSYEGDGTDDRNITADAVPLVTGISLELSYVNQSSAGPTGTKTATASNDADSGVAQILALQAPPVSILYAVTYTAGANGTISGTTPQLVNHGGSGTAVTAVPNTGYHFVDWSDTSTDNPRTDTNVTADLSVTAGFALNQYTLPVNLVGSGSVIKDPDQSICFYGDKITLTAAATPGWTFVEWGGDLSGTDNPKFITLDDNKSVTATFRALLFLPLVVGHYGG